MADLVVRGDGKPTREERATFHRWRTCTGKRRYENPKEATRKATQINEERSNDLLHAYECNYCGRWHIGHERKRTKGSPS